MQDTSAAENELDFSSDRDALIAAALRRAKLAFWSYSFADKRIVEWSPEAAGILGISLKDLPTEFASYLDLVSAHNPP